MATYKVHIAKDGDKTSYTINGHELAAVIKTANGYIVATDGTEHTFAASDEADTAAKLAVTKILNSVGCVPNFINK